MVSILDFQSSWQEPASEDSEDGLVIESEEGAVTASEKDLVTESEEEPITEEPQPASGSEDEQPEDHQASPQEPAGSMFGASKSNWAADPKKALLRRFMGIPADMDSKSQESLSRGFRREVRRFAEIDFTKTWTELGREGETEEMITSISNPLLPSGFNSPILTSCRQESLKG